MIIPIRCFTCGKVLADKWNEYEKSLTSQQAIKDERKDINYIFTKTN